MQIYDYLDTHGIDYERHDHPPVFTCDDVNRLVPALPGRKTKNLFICDNKGKQHFLVTVPDEKSVDLKSFGEALAVKKLRFASADRLQTASGTRARRGDHPGCDERRRPAGPGDRGQSHLGG